MKILGISAFYHDSAAALLVDGDIVAAAQEERFTRTKFDPDFPVNAIAYCLQQAGCRLSDIDHVVMHDKPVLKFSRLLSTYARFAPRGVGSFQKAIPLWLGSKLFQKRQVLRALQAMDPDADLTGKLLFAEHHQSHAASAFYPSPFDRAVILTMDGVGEWVTTSVSVGDGNQISPQQEVLFPHSLGLLYTAMTQYLGFKILSGEYKVMGLAPYGKPIYKDLILDNLIDVKPDGSFWLDQSYFDYCVGQRMFSDKLCDLFGQPARNEETDALTQFHMDVAASLQVATETVVLRMCRDLADRFGIPNICLAGGVALNCVANGKLLRDGAFPNIWIQPAAGDAGCALGAAQAVWHQHLQKPRAAPNGQDGMSGSYLGPAYDQADIEARLTAAGAVFEALDENAMLAQAAQALVDEKAVGWFQGRMEYGPRALGGRSILADARSGTMQKVLNLKVKNRESFRPFAPSVLREDVADWFDFDGDSPYMLMAAPVRAEKCHASTESGPMPQGLEQINAIRSEIPAVTHIDLSARIQTVTADTNPLYHKLISLFKQQTGCPVVVNTSFNVRGEPIVCTPEDAFRCFMGTEIDVLVVGNCVLHKDRQDESLKTDYKYLLDPD